MKRKNYIYILFGLLAFTLTACEDYLDKLPDDRASLNTEEKISSFITSAYGTRNPAFICEYSGDNFSFNGKTYTAQVNQEALWKWEDVPTEGNDDPRSQWNNYYGAIGAANAALEAIADMGNPASLNGQRAEALLCRAWSMFRLANIFCMAYNPEKDEEYLGLPYPKVAGETVEERGTMKELYENIDADIEEALPLIDEDHIKVPKYHFNRKASYAFAARFNLYYMKWEKAIQYATEAIGADPRAVLRDWTEYVPLGSAAIADAYVNSALACNLMLHPAYSLMGRASWSSIYRRYGHSSKSYGYETFGAIAPWTRPAGGSTSASYNSLYKAQKLYGSSPNYRFPSVTEFFEYTDKTGGSGYAHIVDAVFTTDETLLVRIEAEIMMKQYDNAVRDMNYWAGSHCNPSSSYFPTFTVESINEFMESRPYAPTYAESNKDKSLRKVLHPQGFTVESGTQENMIELLLHMRRLETLLQGLRFQDLKRYGIEFAHEIPDEDPLIFEAGDLRGAIQIPNDVVNAGMEPNPRKTASASQE
ncbi:MAG: RagB/SusD family nutrient uptake outer membrane protein [Prevotella sp.]|nr:RagB/SusD family nutrient uptake outer membrane protein [Prevotella sp.]